VFTNVCHHHRLQGKFLLRTDSVVNIGHSVLVFLTTAAMYVNIVYVLCLRRMACVRAVYCRIIEFVFPGKNVILAWRSFVLYAGIFMENMPTTHLENIRN
jgi:hypothetical protein